MKTLKEALRLSEALGVSEALFSRKNIHRIDPFDENNDQNYVVLFNDENNVERLALIANTKDAIRYVKASNGMESDKYSFIILFEYDDNYSDCTFEVSYLSDFLERHDIDKIKIKALWEPDNFTKAYNFILSIEGEPFDAFPDLDTVLIDISSIVKLKEIKFN